MAKYKVEISSSAEKSLKTIPQKDLVKIIQTIEQLAIAPIQLGSRRLKGEHNVYRVRQGKYRIIYQLQAKVLLILVLKIGHRKDVYRK